MSDDLSRKFCDSPFVKFETLIDGTVAPCCSIWTDLRLGHLDTQSFDEIWNSPQAQEMRASILDGSFRHCRKDRCTRIIHNELPDREAVQAPELRRIIDNNLTRLEEKPSWLFLAHDVTCNLACPSCRGGILAADDAQQARFDRIEQDVLAPILSQGKQVKVSLCGQGDPWSSPHYRSLLRRMADQAQDIALNLHTNGLLMTPARWAQYEGLERHRPQIDVSVDACSPWTYAHLRQPGDWFKLLPNLEFFADKRRQGSFSAFSLNATVQLGNFHELGPLVDLGMQLGADGVWLYTIQNTGGHLAASYAQLAVADPAHPLHLAYLETLRDPRLALPVVKLYDVALWRVKALEATLPSDKLAAHEQADPMAFAQAIQNAMNAEDWPLANALAAAARWRHPNDETLTLLEASALQLAGFPREAGYRFRELLARTPGHLDAQIGLATVLAESQAFDESLRVIATLRAAIEDPQMQAQVDEFEALVRSLRPQRTVMLQPA